MIQILIHTSPDDPGIEAEVPQVPSRGDEIYIDDRAYKVVAVGYPLRKMSDMSYTASTITIYVKATR